MQSKEGRIEKLRTVWYERMPFHENNADTGKDMFWETLLIVIDQFQSPEPSKDVEQGAKELCTKFFYWWHNAKGQNTEQGFDEWAKTNEGKNLISQWAEQVTKATTDKQ